MDDLTTLKKINIDEIPTELELARKTYAIALKEVINDPTNEGKQEALEIAENRLKEIENSYHEGAILLIKRLTGAI